MFIIASIVILVIPGPSVLFVIGQSLTLGRRAGLLSVLGNEVGVVPVVFAVAFGVGAIVSASIVLFTIIKIVGACYLAFLGIQAIRHRNDNLSEVTEAQPRSVSSGRVFLQGFIVGVTNPKSLVLFVAVLP